MRLSLVTNLEVMKMGCAFRSHSCGMALHIRLHTASSIEKQFEVMPYHKHGNIHIIEDARKTTFSKSR
jgi:hypothetical protein